MEKTKNGVVYYLPTYIRFKVKDIDRMEISSLEGTIDATFLLTFFYGEIPENIIDQFVGDDADQSILLQFNQMDSIELKVDKGITLRRFPKTKEVEYVVRVPITTELEGEVFLSPFEILNLIMIMTIQKVTLRPKNNDGQKIEIKFNCMDTTMMSNLDYSTNCKLGNYSLAPYFLKMKFLSTDKISFKNIPWVKHPLIMFPAWF